MIAHPLAAAVVLLPQHGDTGVLQHVQQAVPGLGQGLVITTAREVGEHAGHRDRGGGATGAHILEGDQLLLLAGEAVGLLLVAVEGVILAARRLADHQEHQGRLVALAHHLGIGTDRLVRDGGGEHHIPGVAIDTPDIVGRYDFLDQAVVVAPDRGVILVIKGADPEQEQQGERDAPEA
ncbi:hypothetical protein D3C79_702180 [compost metagenome]